MEQRTPKTNSQIAWTCITADGNEPGETGFSGWGPQEQHRRIVVALDAKDSIIEGLRARLKDPMCSRCRDPKAPPISPETLCYSCLKKRVADLTAEVERLKKLKVPDFICPTHDFPQCPYCIKDLSMENLTLRRAMEWAGGYICNLTNKGPNGEIEGKDCFQFSLETKCPVCTCKDALNLAKREGLV